MNNNQKSDSIIGYIAATAPVLLQLIGVLSISLVDALNLEEFVLLPRFINIANFLVVLLSVSLISLASFWDYNKFALGNGTSPFNQTILYWDRLKLAFKISLLCFILFIGIIIFKSAILNNIEFWTLLQWIGYIGGLVSVSFIIYSFTLLKIQEKRNNLTFENYIPRLVDSLRRYGHVKDPDIVIEHIDRNNLQAVVKLGGASKYIVTTDFTGEMTSISGMKIVSKKENSI